MHCRLQRISRGHQSDGANQVPRWRASLGSSSRAVDHMKLSPSKKVLLVTSFGFIPLRLACLWAGSWWVQHVGGFLRLHVLLYFLAVVLPLVGVLNARNILRGQRKDNASGASDDEHEV